MPTTGRFNGVAAGGPEEAGVAEGENTSLSDATSQ